GGFFVLLACIGVGIAGVLLLGGGGPDIVGTWEQREFIVIRYEFRPDGTGTMNSIVAINFNYTLSGGELTITPTGVAGIQGVRGNSVRHRVTRTGDTLRLEDVNTRKVITLHKVR
ncbi:MAG TPA: DUF5640 domain-containing protein, partial [Gemmataceae bacterium]|nr:DUF5640 domain-containing protein [Gemmataceae bacterium]